MRCFFLFCSSSLLVALWPSSLWAQDLLPALLCTQATTNPSGSVLFVHGLNQNPDSFEDFSNFFRGKNFQSCILTLEGHNRKDDSESWPIVSHQTWVREVQTSYRLLLKQNKPVLILGYSLGAAIVIRALDELLAKPSAQGSSDPAPPRAMFLFAPAVSASWSAHLLRLLLPLKIFGINLPSFSPAPYRVRSSTSLQAYAESLALIESIESLHSAPALSAIPTLVFARDDDELVSIHGLVSWLDVQTSNSWKLHLLAAQTRTDFPEHLFIDQDSLGDNQWNEVIFRMEKLLQEH